MTRVTRVKEREDIRRESIRVARVRYTFKPIERVTSMSMFHNPSIIVIVSISLINNWIYMSTDVIPEKGKSGVSTL